MSPSPEAPQLRTRRALRTAVAAALALATLAVAPGEAAARSPAQITVIPRQDFDRYGADLSSGDRGLLQMALESGLLEAALDGGLFDPSAGGLGVDELLNAASLATGLDPTLLAIGLQLIDVQMVRQRDRALDRADRAFARGDRASAQRELDRADRIEDRRARRGLRDSDVLSRPRFR